MNLIYFNHFQLSPIPTLSLSWLQCFLNLFCEHFSQDSGGLCQPPVIHYGVMFQAYFIHFLCQTQNQLFLSKNPWLLLVEMTLWCHKKNFMDTELTGFHSCQTISVSGILKYMLLLTNSLLLQLILINFPLSITRVFRSTSYSYQP